MRTSRSVVCAMVVVFISMMVVHPVIAADAGLRIVPREVAEALFKQVDEATSEKLGRGDSATIAKGGTPTLEEWKKMSLKEREDAHVKEVMASDPLLKASIKGGKRRPPRHPVKGIAVGGRGTIHAAEAKPEEKEQVQTLTQGTASEGERGSQVGIRRSDIGSSGSFEGGPSGGEDAQRAEIKRLTAELAQAQVQLAEALKSKQTQDLFVGGLRQDFSAVVKDVQDITAEKVRLETLLAAAQPEFAQVREQVKIWQTLFRQAQEAMAAAEDTFRAERERHAANTGIFVRNGALLMTALAEERTANTLLQLKNAELAGMLAAYENSLLQRAMYSVSEFLDGTPPVIAAWKDTLTVGDEQASRLIAMLLGIVVVFVASVVFVVVKVRRRIRGRKRLVEDRVMIETASHYLAQEVDDRDTVIQTHLFAFRSPDNLRAIGFHEVEYLYRVGDRVAALCGELVSANRVKHHFEKDCSLCRALRRPASQAVA